MLSIVKSISLHGIEGYLVNVQVDVAGGLPHWEVVGLPDASVKESKERVRIAIKNSNIDFPSRRIIVNLAPANTKKEGTFFDLPIAIGILIATENINCNNIEEYAFVGELSLDGKVNKINGILPMCAAAQKIGIKNIVVPKENAKEAAIVKGIKVISVENLEEIIQYLNKEKEIAPTEINIEEFFNKNTENLVDFSEVKGQENVKRALEIAAAGAHNCLLIGSPRFPEKLCLQKEFLQFYQT